MGIVAAWALAFTLLGLAPTPVQAELALLQGYGQAQGLGNLAITTLAQDKDGYIWAGTQNGLYRFDGERFVRVGQEDHLVGIVALAADPQGGLWVGANSGLYHWQPGAVHHVARADGRPLQLIGSADLALDPSGTPWVISDSLLYEVRRVGGPAPWQAAEALDPLPAGVSGPTLSSVAAAQDGTLWLGCGTGLCRRAGRRLERATGGDSGVANQPWGRIWPARNGSLWLRSATRMAELPPGGSAPIDRGLPATAADVDGLAHSVAEDGRGRLITAGRGALARLAGKGASGGSWQVFDRSHGMPPGGRFLALLVDRDGGLWLSRAGTGLWRWLGYERWEHWSSTDGLPHDVAWSVVRDRAGTLHVATSAGVARFDDRARRFAVSPGTAGVHISTLHADAGGRLWAATADDRLLRRDPGPATAFVSATKEPISLYGLRDRPDGSLWFAGTDGIGWWADAANRPRPFGKPTLVGEHLLAQELCESPSGTLWGALSTGVQRIAASGEITRLADERLHGNIPSIACGRDGTVFAANNQGRIYRIANGDAQPQVIDITPPLLAGRVVLTLVHDRRGWLWVNTDAGVAVWNGQLWRLIDQPQGLIWNDTSSGGLFEDGDGTMWISTSQGLSHLIDPASIFAPVLPAIRISAILHAGRPQAPGARLALPWTRSSALEVALEAPSYRDRATQAFEHRLVGFDDTWHRTGGSVIRYAGLPAGSYRLQARLADAQLGTSSAPVTLDLDIDAPWWETWFFRFAVGALAAAAAIGVHRWRMRLARQRERELAELVAERTHELEASREELRERATKDGLTGAWNRRTVLEMLAHDAERCARDQQPLTVVLADIDHFKRINDELGHPAGDEVLRQFVSRLRAVVRPYDAIRRYGGEEFVLLLRGLCTDQPEDRARIDAIHAAIAAAPMQLADGVERLVTCSFGAACARPGAAASQADLIQRADQALYRAKRAGRDRVEFVALDACRVDK